ncbi:MAG TPA: ParB/RepB/Spo0J family partition protein, partial [Kiritimatiellia bacterium]|nr:ParB/RepB/Spo0J family partition protein [Kiritimatiellia bacterium]
MAAKHVGLGRGLGALIKEVPAAPKAEEKGAPAGITRIAIDSIRKNPFQPRHAMEQEPLADLVRSIREKGILQPLLVRPASDGYELIAGERRLTAAREARLREVPVIIMSIDDREALEIALIENLQRENLNVIEEADGYHELCEKFGMTQEEVAARVGRSRAAVTNTLRILGLPD